MTASQVMVRSTRRLRAAAHLSLLRVLENSSSAREEREANERIWYKRVLNLPPSSQSSGALAFLQRRGSNQVVVLVLWLQNKDFN